MLCQEGKGSSSMNAPNPSHFTGRGPKMRKADFQ